MSAIEIDGISKRFGSVQAGLGDIDLPAPGVVLLLAWIGAAFAAGAALLRARDVEWAGGEEMRDFPR